MRLAKIKLAGFKSFVDPTTLLLPSNLMGVVGPNGCGKSNIIDAVRWVMGESSPKLLRGDAMADVIFSGSRSRKPVGMANVELVFDNSDGKIAGEYARYNEISVKRTLSRDGKSEYLLNGSRCRRRDITDLFLGTGIGPRSYAIIEQGMISKLVEAKPEELRVYMEEAAGISIYKERRRETENRIRHTEDNLSRLSDLREEVGKQLNHLQRQARAAERYREFKAEHRQLWAQQQGHVLQDLENQFQKAQQGLAERDTAVEKATAELRQAEADTESLRNDRSQAQERLNQVQQQVYANGSDISACETRIRHAEQQLSRAEHELGELQSSLARLNEQIETDAEQAQQLAEQIETLLPAREQLDDQLIEAEASAEVAEAQLREAGERLEKLSRDHQVGERERLHQQQRLQQAGDSLRQWQERRQKLMEERDALPLDEQQQAVEEAQLALEQAEQSLASDEDSLAQRKQGIEQLEAQERQQRDGLHQAQRELQQSEGRLTALEALQASSLGSDHRHGEESGHADAWLTAQNAEQQPLAQKLDVKPGAETAVEAALGAMLSSALSERPLAATDASAAISAGQLTWADASGKSSSASAERLLSQVSGPAVLEEWLGRFWLAEDVASAQALLPQLVAGECVVTRQGEFVGRGWWQVNRDSDPRRGVLARERERRELEQLVTEQREALAARGEQLDVLVEQLQQQRQKRDEQQTGVNEQHRQRAQWQARLSEAKHRQDSLDQRRRTLGEQVDTLAEQIEQEQLRCEAAEERLEALLASSEQIDEQLKSADEQRSQVRQRAEQARERVLQLRTERQRLEIDLQSRQAEQRSHATASERLRAQHRDQQARFDKLISEKGELGDPLPEQRERLEQLLQARGELEDALGAARKKLEDVDHRLQEVEQQRQQAQQAIDAQREQLESQRLRQQELRLRGETVRHELERAEVDWRALLEGLPEQAPGDLAGQLEQLEGKIQRLEPVNLAAIDEFAQQQERKDYLDAQNEDLEAALESLRQAIERIDKTTRTRFRDTFETVNDNFSKLFPKLFGGGQGFLDLTEQDVLAAGVRIMAQPPGKRVSNIHLLSGGEKALTAVALVFAIFELNPAPFCLLDEVDAPLDEANVGRFSRLVAEMSERVQMLFVTHNKTTMEAAQQLAGVTMAEPGVSRLVSVDVEEAAAAAEAS
jgi:chromosome segregation protein